jgi:hypothetical protein
VRRLTIAPVAIALGLTGCGGSSETAKIKATLAALTRAAAGKDYASLCRHILAPQLIQRLTQVGLPCDVALARGLGAVSAPKLSVRSVEIRGNTALARVHTTAVNQPSSDDTVELTKIAGQWYVLSLVAPPKR